MLQRGKEIPTLRAHKSGLSYLKRALCSLPPMFVLILPITRLFAQGFAADWPAAHRSDLSRCAAKTGLAFHSLDKLTKVATEDDAQGVEEKYFWYTIENLDTTSLHQQRQILLSTWAAGTGHCMTLYVLKKTGAQFQKVWQSQENLCTESILGAARSQAMPDGRIIVRFRERSSTVDEKEEAHILDVEITYKWNGTSYVKTGRKQQPESGATPQSRGKPD